MPCCAGVFNFSRFINGVNGLQRIFRKLIFGEFQIH